MARSGELAVEEDGRLYAPLELGESWQLEQLLSDGEIAEMLRIPFQEAHRLVLEASVPVYRTRDRLFSVQKFRSAIDLGKRLETYTRSHGLELQEAALELGLTLASCRSLVEKVPYHSNGRVLKVLLEAFRNRFLPRDKVWSTRTSLLSEFIDNFNRENPSSPILAQPCEVDGCGHAASAQCKNTKCRASEPPRFVCPAHEEWVDAQDMRRRPPALCPSCASKVRDGKLLGFQLL